MEDRKRDPRIFYIDTNVPESILNKFGDYFAQDRAASLQAGVGVDLNKPHIVVGIDHEIQPKNLEIVDPSIRINVQS